MTFAIAAGLLALSLLAYAWFRSWIAPGALYPAYWACIVIGVALLPIGDHRLSTQALLVFLVGAVAYVGASGLALLVASRSGPRTPALRWQLSPRRKRLIQNGMLAYAALLSGIIPAFITAVRAAGDALGIEDFAAAARLSMGLADRAGIPNYFESATTVGIFLAHYAACIYEGTRRDRLTLIAITASSLAMSALTFGRSPVVALLLGVLSILAMRRAIRPAVIAVTFAATVALAVGMGVLLNKGPELELGKSPARAVIENLAIYFVGGPVGFSAVMDDPAYVGEPGLSLRLPKKVLAWTGLKLPLPEDVHDYAAADLPNVYTFYYPYWFDGRWLGVILVTMAAGFVATLVYEAGRRGHPIAGAASGIVVAAVLTSAVGDGMFTTPMQWLLIAVLGWLLWHVPIPGSSGARSTA